MGREDEREPLVAPTIPEDNVRVQPTGHVAMAVQDAPEGGRRDWDGHLLACCGNCDPNGLSTFAYVKYCTPCAWGHNMKRAFKASFWKHAVLFVLLFSGWWWMYAGLAARAGMVCGPPPTHPNPGHEHHDLGKPWQEHPLKWEDPILDKPQETSKAPEKVFLTGATWQPENFNTEEVPPLDLSLPENQEASKEIEEIGAAVQEQAKQMASAAEKQAGEIQQAVEMASSQTEQQVKDAASQVSQNVNVNLSAANDQLNAQLQWAKQQVAEGMAQLNAQLGAGRKLLHKHHNDDDDEDHKDKHHNKDHKDKHHDKDHEDKLRDKDHDDKDHEHHGPKHEGHPPEFGPESPECLAAMRSMMAMWAIAFLSLLFGVHYAARTRTAIRERFGIPATEKFQKKNGQEAIKFQSSRLKDCFAWLFCSPCALCQETRTLSANNVQSGIWFGPTMLASPHHPLQAPEPQLADGKPAKVVDDEAVAKV